MVVGPIFVQNVKGESDGKNYRNHWWYCIWEVHRHKFSKTKRVSVVDADAHVHQLQKPGGRLFQILVEHFGGEGPFLKMVN